MYFDSFVSADLVGQDPQRFSVVDRYHDARWQRPDAYDQVLDAQAMGRLLARGVITLVSHVPTCFYDRAWLAEEVARSHAYTLDLPSPFWDVPLHRGAALQQPLAAGPGRPGRAAAQAYQCASRARAGRHPARRPAAAAPARAKQQVHGLGRSARALAGT